MSEIGEEDNGRFLRQRRNLVVLSAALIFVQFTHVTFEKLAFAGLEMQLMDAPNVWVALAVLWAYWLLRYYQAFLVSGGYDRISGFYFDSRDAVLKKRAIEVLRVAWKQKVAATPEFEGAHPIDPGLDSPVSVRGWHASIVLIPRISFQHGETAKRMAREEVRLGALDIARAMLPALWRLTFKSMHVTDYILPFILGATPAIIWVYRHWLIVSAYARSVASWILG